MNLMQAMYSHPVVLDEATCTVFPSLAEENSTIPMLCKGCSLPSKKKKNVKVVLLAFPFCETDKRKGQLTRHKPIRAQLCGM